MAWWEGGGGGMVLVAVYPSRIIMSQSASTYQPVASTDSHSPSSDPTAPPSDETAPLHSHSEDDEPWLDAEDDDIIHALRPPPRAPFTSPDPPIASTSSQSARVGGGNDGVFANIPAKPQQGGHDENKDREEPPPYEEAAQDQVPSYFETTVLAGEDPDEILVEGLPVGSSISFVWNMLISMTFQFIGFLITYLLHTSHAGKNGSRAGLGITLIQYALYMRSPAIEQDEYEYLAATNPDWSPQQVTERVQEEFSQQTEGRMAVASYLLMVVGWFLIMRSTGEYIRVRRILAAMLTTPDGAV